MSKQYRRRLTVFGTISLLVVLLFVYNLFSYIKLVNDLENEEKDLQNKLVELQKENVNLKEEIEKLKNPEYLERYARENFLYSKDGEYVIRIDDNNNPVIEMNTTNVEYRQKIVIILGCILFTIIIIYIIFKRKRSYLEE